MDFFGTARSYYNQAPRQFFTYSIMGISSVAAQAAAVKATGFLAAKTVGWLLAPVTTGVLTPAALGIAAYAGVHLGKLAGENAYNQWNAQDYREGKNFTKQSEGLGINFDDLSSWTKVDLAAAAAA